MQSRQNIARPNRYLEPNMSPPQFSNPIVESRDLQVARIPYQGQQIAGSEIMIAPNWISNILEYFALKVREFFNLH